MPPKRQRILSQPQFFKICSRKPVLFIVSCALTHHHEVTDAITCQMDTRSEKFIRQQAHLPCVLGCLDYRGNEK